MAGPSSSQVIPVLADIIRRAVDAIVAEGENLIGECICRCRLRCLFRLSPVEMRS